MTRLISITVLMFVFVGTCMIGSGCSGASQTPVTPEIVEPPLNPVDVTPPWLNFSPHKVCARDDILFVDGSVNGFQIIDASNKKNPVWLNRVEIPDHPEYGSSQVTDIEIEGDYAYVATSHSDIVIVDISSPSSARIVNEADATMHGDIAVENGYAFCASDYYSKLSVVDVDPVLSAYEVTIFETGLPIIAIDAQNEYVYILSREDESPDIFVILDVSEPESPQEIHRSYLPGDTSNIAVNEGFAYVMNSEYGLQIIDIDQPSETELVHTLDIPLGPEDIAFEGGYAFLTNGSDELFVVDISSPDKAKLCSSFDLPYNGNYIAVDDGYAYVTSNASGIYVIDISYPESIYVTGSILTPGDCGAVHINGSFAYVGCYSGIHVIDIESPESAFLSHVIDKRHAEDIDESGDYSYFTDHERLEILDISNPGSEFVCCEVDISNALDVAVSGDSAYVATYAGDDDIGIVVVDISTPETARIIETFRFKRTRHLWAVFILLVVENGYAYILCSGELSDFTLYIVDVDPVASARVIKSLDLGGGYFSSLSIDSGYVYITLNGMTFGKLAIVDVDPPEDAYVVKAKRVDWGWSYAGVGKPAVSHGYAYIPNNTVGLVIYDVDPPEEFHRISEVYLTGTGRDVALRDNYAFVTHSGGGLRIIKLW